MTNNSTYKQSFKEIDAPIAIFNNIIHDITNNICQIINNKNTNHKSNNNLYNINMINNKDKNNIFDKLAVNSSIIFVDDTILIYGWLKLYLHNQKMLMKINKPNLEYNDLRIINSVYNNYETVAQNFYRYIMMYNKIAFGVDDVPLNLIVTIKDEILKNSKNKQFNSTSYLLPFKNKMSKNDVENDWNDFYCKYDFAIKFFYDNVNNFKYCIYKLSKSELNENRSLENIRYLESDIIKKDSVAYRNVEEFLKQLFIYGNIIK